MASNFHRFFGGSPGSVIVKLLFLSLLVGAFMAMLGLTPMGLVDSVVDMFGALWNLGFGAFETVGKWLLYGAIIVIPIWIIARLMRGFR
ncbi:MAG: integrase [Salinarimonadaceae bacterium]|nr:MAG: integrase [Salinarimonadaceae bacterium]